MTPKRFPRLNKTISSRTRVPAIVNSIYTAKDFSPTVNDSRIPLTKTSRPDGMLLGPRVRSSSSRSEANSESSSTRSASVISPLVAITN